MRQQRLGKLLPKHSDEARARHRAAVARVPKDQWAERSRKGCAAARTAKPTSIERAAAAVLEALGVGYLPNHQIGRYVVDFYIPASRLVIECDGTYWHSLPGAPEKDAVRDAYLTAQGLRVVRIGERSFTSGAHEGILKACVAEAV